MSFRILKRGGKTGARKGLLYLPHGRVHTPCFMSCASKGAVKGITPEELENLGAEIILSNTYHLIQQPGLDLLKKAGGLHKFIGWDRPILTDSGGYQIFSLAKKRKVVRSGVKFFLKGGEEYFLTPESCIEAQFVFGSDIIMVLDECLSWPSSHEKAEKSLSLTLEWAWRAKKYFERRVKRVKKRPLLFGIIQGGVYKDLRKESVEKLLKIGFDGYAIGGLSVGEPREMEMKILAYTLSLLPEKFPCYFMGVGRPEDVREAIKLGVDMFDCVIPTREARHGRVYLKRGENKYKVARILNKKFRFDFFPPGKDCACPCCQKYSRAYLHHLFKVGDPLGARLASLHNLYFYLNLVKETDDLLV